MEIEYVDAEGIKTDGTKSILSIPLVHVPRMKMKDIIAGYFGCDFSDEDSTESICLYAMEDFLKWYQEQIKLVEGQA